MSHISLTLCLSALSMIFAVSVQSAMADQPAEVALNELGALSLRFTKVTASSHFAGLDISAQVSAYPNSAMPVSRVIENAAITWLVPPGTPVAKGQAVLQLEGSEVHHFLTEYETRKAYFLLVKKRFDDNRALFQRQAISSNAWQDISLAYQTALLDFEHLDHFYERISNIRADHLQITLSAPIAGVVLTAAQSTTAIFRVVPSEHIRLKGTLADYQTQPDTVSFGQCQLDLAQVEAVSQGFSRIWWSAPLGTQAECQANWQQQINVSPTYAQAVYRIPNSSIVRHDRQQYVWLKSASILRLVPVSIVAKEDDSFWVQSDEFTVATEILTQSVSAVYGHYLGLGGE